MTIATTDRRRTPRRNLVTVTAQELGDFTPADLARLEAATARPVDTSDIPEITDAEWAGFQPGTEANKVPLTLRVRPEVLAFFKGSNPRGYQRRINAVLEHFASTHRGDR